MSEARVVTVNVRNVGFGGAGIGEVVAQDNGESDLLGITAFVPFAASGELVSARIVQKKDRYLKTQLVDIESRSPKRVAPRCEVFTTCGGCELQHISYEGQLSAKYEMVKGQLQAARFEEEVLQRVEPVIPGEPYRYRRRITLHIDSSGRVGFYRENSRSVVPIDSCPVAVESIEEFIGRIQDFGREVQGRVSRIVLDSDPKGVVAVLNSPYEMGSIERRDLLEKAKQYFENVSLLEADKEVGGFGRQIIELPLNDVGSLTLRVPAGNFSQVNWSVNMRLIESVLAESGVKYGMDVVDLFSGAGNFALPLARAGAKVEAVEVDSRLATLGRENARRYRLNQLEYVETSVEKYLGKGKRRAVSRFADREVDVVVADPPRSGLSGLVSILPPAKKLLFVSCHLPSFVRDLRSLSDGGWNVSRIQLFDMFSQTSKVEILGVFEKGARRDNL